MAVTEEIINKDKARDHPVFPGYSVQKITCDSMGEMIERIESNPNQLGIRSRASMREDGSVWQGEDTWQGAKDLCLNGWSVKRAEVKAMVNLIKTNLDDSKQRQRVKRRGIVGTQLSLPHYLGGDPKCAMRVVRPEVSTKGKVLTLLINSGAAGSVPADKILERGAAVVALTDVLQSMGHQIRISMISMVATRDHGMFATEVRVKNPGQPLLMDKVTFALANPSWHRRMVFGLRETFDNKSAVQANFSRMGGYGISMDVTKEDKGTVIVPKIDERVRYDAEWVIGMLETLGLTIKRGKRVAS